MKIYYKGVQVIDEKRLAERVTYSTAAFWSFIRYHKEYEEGKDYFFLAKGDVSAKSFVKANGIQPFIGENALTLTRLYARSVIEGMQKSAKSARRQCELQEILNEYFD